MAAAYCLARDESQSSRWVEAAGKLAGIGRNCGGRLRNGRAGDAHRIRWAAAGKDHSIEVKFDERNGWQCCATSMVGSTLYLSRCKKMT